MVNDDDDEDDDDGDVFPVDNRMSTQFKSNYSRHCLDRC